MPPVFAHGRLRLYLLKLLDEAPRHGYEVIRLLEERFQGLYAPSAGTVYPRLAKLEAEGLVTHTTEGGRKVYSPTDAGRAELAERQGELADLELEIRESVSELAAEIREDVRGSAGDLRREMRAAARNARTSDRPPGSWDDGESRQRAKEDMQRLKEEWKEQARRAKEESRRARQDAQEARRQAREAQQFAHEEVERIARRVQERTQEHVRAGDWQQAMREGFAEISREMNRFSRQGPDTAGPHCGTSGTRPAGPDLRKDTGASHSAGPPAPAWADEPLPPDADPARELERLLDRFRDDVRDAARDHGVTPDQLAQARSRLAAAATQIGRALRGLPER
ncbi:PadR family transcriptional regulator [Streptomyces meridianus]|uniref:Helix-turn-helix transcriptional regulator n=1 Tax=Streptomyces meridianus TaxID=2938945 RepID=A0ABT0X0J8_9ACTN|nr:helix-turn-helix transcriptional regulator [Streptomyces meridianus]MCM2576087.1 helix-turn-helix transcriptional regulator [Streptomyces meridianus]